MMIQSVCRDKDCLKIWESLKAAFVHKNPCNATTEDYRPLMELTSHPVPCNKVTAGCTVGLCKGNCWEAMYLYSTLIFSIVTVGVCRWTRLIVLPGWLIFLPGSSWLSCSDVPVPQACRSR